jgi:hypothetical protein
MLGRAFFKTEVFPGWIRGGGRRVFDDVAKVKEMLLRGGASRWGDASGPGGGNKSEDGKSAIEDVNGREVGLNLARRGLRPGGIRRGFMIAEARRPRPSGCLRQAVCRWPSSLRFGSLRSAVDF